MRPKECSDSETICSQSSALKKRAEEISEILVSYIESTYGETRRENIFIFSSPDIPGSRKYPIEASSSRRAHQKYIDPLEIKIGKMELEAHIGCYFEIREDEARRFEEKQLGRQHRIGPSEEHIITLDGIIRIPQTDFNPQEAKSILFPKFHDILIHEVRHLIQSKRSEPSKDLNPDRRYPSLIPVAIRFEYLMRPEEIDAYIISTKRESERKKVPHRQVIEDFVDRMFVLPAHAQGKTPKVQRLIQKVKDTWIKRAEDLGYNLDKFSGEFTDKRLQKQSRKAMGRAANLERDLASIWDED